FISASGRYVLFTSISTNLVAGDTVSCGGPPGNCQDVFVHDRDADGNGIFDETGVGQRRTVMVSVSSSGVPGDARSGADRMGITPDGRFVVFGSNATNLDGVDTNGVQDVFVHDRDADADGIFDETGPGERSTVRISSDINGLAAAGVSGDPSISDDGRFVVFS